MTPPEAGKLGLNLNVPAAVPHVGVAAAAPPGDVITTIDSSVATAKKTPKDLRIRSPLRLVQLSPSQVFNKSSPRCPHLAGRAVGLPLDAERCEIDRIRRPDASRRRGDATP